MKPSALWGRVWRVVRWPLLVVVVLFVIYAAWGTYLAFDKQNTDALVADIHAQKITLADVQGINLPPVPNKTENDATVAGIDKNNNGIRDDVELSIFNKYPGTANAKIRAAELQYALTEQMFLTRVTNTETWKAVAEENFRAHGCVIQFGADRKEVESLTFNTQLRIDARDRAFEFTTGHGEAQGAACDVSL